MSETTGAKKQIRRELAIVDLMEWLEKEKITVRRNVLSHRIEISGLDPAFDRETLDSNLPVILCDALKKDYRCTPATVTDQLGVIAGLLRFNPVLDLLDRAPAWDGIDRFEALFSALHIGQDDKLSRTLIRKSFYQAYALMLNDSGTPFGADGVLCLLGRQGIGKTRFVAWLGVRPEFVRLGAWIDFRDKDTVIRATSAWITELGELETTLRTDTERLKSFVTSSTDSYRLPYARADSNLLRRTSFIATANSERLLVDPTGSRRFWTVPLESIDLDALQKVDVVQLWKQAEVTVRESGLQCFRLTKDEQSALAERNGAHERPLKSQDEIEDIFAAAANDPKAWEWRYSTVSTFKDENSALRSYSVEAIGKALDRLGVTQTVRRVDGKKGRFRWLPMHKYSL